MNKIKTIFSLRVLLLIVQSSCIKEKEEDGADIQVGYHLPDLNITLNDGTSITNQSLNGKVSVIVLFSVSCPDCQEQLPILNQLYKEYQGNNKVLWFGISREEGKEEVGEYWKENNLILPYSAQETREIYSLFARSGVPRIYISDKQCIVQTLFTDRPIASYQQLKSAVDWVLEEME